MAPGTDWARRTGGARRGETQEKCGQKYARKWHRHRRGAPAGEEKCSASAAIRRRFGPAVNFICFLRSYTHRYYKRSIQYPVHKARPIVFPIALCQPVCVGTGQPNKEKSRGKYRKQTHNLEKNHVMVSQVFPEHLRSFVFFVSFCFFFMRPAPEAARAKSSRTRTQAEHTKHNGQTKWRGPLFVDLRGGLNRVFFFFFFFFFFFSNGIAQGACKHNSHVRLLPLSHELRNDRARAVKIMFLFLFFSQAHFVRTQIGDSCRYRCRHKRVPRRRQQ